MSSAHLHEACIHAASVWGCFDQMYQATIDTDNQLNLGVQPFVAQLLATVCHMQWLLYEKNTYLPRGNSTGII